MLVLYYLLERHRVSPSLHNYLTTKNTLWFCTSVFQLCKVGSPSCPIHGVKLPVLPLWALYKHWTTNFFIFSISFHPMWNYLFCHYGDCISTGRQILFFFISFHPVSEKKHGYSTVILLLSFDLWIFLFSWASHTLACFPAPLRQFYQQNPCPQETKQDLRQRVDDEYRRWKCKLPSSQRYRLCIGKLPLLFYAIVLTPASSLYIGWMLGGNGVIKGWPLPPSCLSLQGCYISTNLHEGVYVAYAKMRLHCRVSIHFKTFLCTGRCFSYCLHMINAGYGRKELREMFFCLQR